MTSSRDQILNALKKNKGGNLPLFNLDNSEQSPFIQPQGNLIDIFKERLELINGHCIICRSEQDFQEKFSVVGNENGWNNIQCKNETILSLLEKSNITFTTEPENYNTIDATITTCDFLSARTGSVVVTSTTLGERRIIAYPPTHIVFAHENQLFADLDEIMEKLQVKYTDCIPSQITVITGPSRTADIEKTLILGAHGPKDFFVFLMLNKET